MEIVKDVYLEREQARSISLDTLLAKSQEAHEIADLGIVNVYDASTWSYWSSAVFLREKTNNTQVSVILRDGDSYRWNDYKPVPMDVVFANRRLRFSFQRDG